MPPTDNEATCFFRNTFLQKMFLKIITIIQVKGNLNYKKRNKCSLLRIKRNISLFSIFFLQSNTF